MLVSCLQVWVLYSSVTLYYLYACSFRKLDKTLPKQVGSKCSTMSKINMQPSYGQSFA